MDADRFESFLRSLSASPSRRSAVRILAGLALGSPLALGVGGGKAHNALKKCKKIEDKAKRKQCRKKAKKHNATHASETPPPPLPPPPLLTYQCPGPHNNFVGGGSDNRFAQTFTAAQSGSLQQIQFGVNKTETSGDYVVQLLRVISGVPSHSPLDVLAAVTVPDGAVALGQSTLTGTFTGPALVAGTEYAAAFQRPGSPNTAALVRVGDGSACSGRSFGAAGAAAFIELVNHDILVSVLVV